MQVNIYIRTGHFNFLRPEDEQTLFHVQIDDRSISFDVDNEGYYYNTLIDEFPVDAIKEAYEEDKKKLWIDSARKEKDEFLSFVKKNEKEITKVFLEERLKETKKKVENLQGYINLLNKRIMEL